MAILDNRTAIDAFDGTLDTNDYVGQAPALDPLFSYQGTQSIGDQLSNSVRFVMYNYGTPTNLSNQIFYVLVNCTAVGNLALKANGGFAIRFCGSDTTTGWFEVYVAGNDFWPTSFAGGWTMFVVDIERAKTVSAANGWEGSSPAATNQIQYVGFSGLTQNMVTGNIDNIFLNGLWSLPSNTPGIIVEGQNTGSTAWTFADILSANDTNKWGSFRSAAGGAYVCNTPIAIGNTNTDSVVHEFNDANRLLLWESNEYVIDGFYSITGLASSTNTVDINFGIKTGTGTDATGAQGITIQSDPSVNTRWNLDMNDSNLNTATFYGSVFTNSNIINFDNNVVESISNFFIDGNELVQSLGSETSLFQRNTVIQANTADGTAYIKSIDLDNIKYNDFQFSDGHAIEITTLGAALTGENFIGNIFTGYSTTINSTDAAIYNNSGQSVTINASDSNLSTTSYRNGGVSTTTITNNINVNVKGLKDNTEVRIYDYNTLDNMPPYDTPTEIAGIENATAGTTNDRSFTFSIPSGTDVLIRCFNIDWIADDFALINPTVSRDVEIAQRRDRVFDNP